MKLSFNEIQIFKRLDEIIFAKIDQLQNNERFVLLLENFKLLPLQTKQIVKRSLGLSFFLIPLLIIFPLFWSGRTMKNTISVKEDILLEAKEILKVNKNFQGLKNLYNGGSPINSESDVINRIRQVSVAIKVAPENLNVVDFNIENNPNVNLNNVSFRLIFKKLGITELTSLFTQLKSTQRFIITGASIKMITAAKLLEGELTITAFSDNAGGEEEL